ncbi:hypothetical protein PDQ36_13065 [Bacillus cereus]|jgi:tetratricopeptide (TPR) repeat protein|uniref:Tetratricopeptide repeat protein n=3 Tax=Bacillus TaxID=1386 RepID=A0A2B0XFZ9_BACAN|nr:MULTISPECIES: hypothetical protein [Bacillus]BCA32339.1 hypothetical protein BwiPL1_07210 [Bacillus wiedmannii]MBJ7955042.1 hypothetical protein [Bacillus cereus]MBJ8058116.1 hypothetical protein [Bacillus cereus]MBT0790602.1 hypothetical protein [Bacillus cereus]MBT2198378.1 hypothetical protein [Bacillus thuringiensis]
MAILQSPIKEEFESLLEKSNEQFNNGNYNDSIVLLEEAWDIIPNPKGIYCEESYHLVKDIISTCFMVNDLKKAKEWADKIFLTGFARIDSGDKEFIAGKVAFELDDLETAKEFFSIANTKSEGRCFGNPKNTKYLKFLKS